MKILVFSDSHGELRHMVAAVLREQPDQLLHLGDREQDAARLEARFPQIPLLSVPGNCDYPMPGRQLTLLREFDGARILMTHGHRYDVKRGLLAMELAAREAGADVAVFGHTHIPYCENLNGLWLMNPGACGRGGSTCGVLRIENGKAHCELLAI